MTESVPTVPLDGGPGMPLLGFGTWLMNGSECYEAVRTALDAGYRHVDTAAMYRNEAEVGRALRDSGVDRDAIFVTTKLPPPRADKADQVLAGSLDALGVDAVVRALELLAVRVGGGRFAPSKRLRAMTYASGDAARFYPRAGRPFD